VAAVQSFVHAAAAACPDLNVKLIVEEPLQHVLRTAISSSNASAGDQSKPGQPQLAAVAEVCRAVDAQRVDDLAHTLDALATELAPADELPSAMLISGSTARLAVFCKLLAADAQPDDDQQQAADDQHLLKAWARAYDQLGAMSLSDVVAGLRWLLHGLPCPLPMRTVAGEQDTAGPPATPLSATARGVIVRDSAAVLSDTLSGARATNGEIDGQPTAAHSGVAVTDDDARAAAAALLQELRMKMLTADAVATVQARCVLSEAGLGLVEAALELAADGADGLEAALPECLQVGSPSVCRQRYY